MHLNQYKLDLLCMAIAGRVTSVPAPTLQSNRRVNRSPWRTRRMRTNSTTTVLRIQGADGNKDLEAAISDRTVKLSGFWQCKDCLWETKHKTRLWEHSGARQIQRFSLN